MDIYGNIHIPTEAQPNLNLEEQTKNNSYLCILPIVHFTILLSKLNTLNSSPQQPISNPTAQTQGWWVKELALVGIFLEKSRV